VRARINRYLAGAGLGSRRAVEALVRDRRVTVNGTVADLATRVDDGDDVRLDGMAVLPAAVEVVLLHKPAGVITTSDDEHGRRTVVELVESEARLFPVGRLDRDTTGIIVLTNDGALAHRLMHPRHGVTKTYRARVAGDPGGAELDRLRAGIELDDGPTAPAEVTRVGPGEVELTIHEGRNRQVRRMLAAVGHPVTHLHRSRYAGLGVGDLPPGGWRRLSPAEVERLRHA
jgi:23S rRNA pseudouridine2605 synthase